MPTETNSHAATVPQLSLSPTHPASGYLAEVVVFHSKDTTVFSLLLGGPQCWVLVSGKKAEGSCVAWKGVHAGCRFTSCLGPEACAYNNGEGAMFSITAD